MFGSSNLDIAIGVMFVFLLLSLIASTVNEVVLSFLNLRGRYLLRGIKTLLDDKDGKGLVRHIYNHGEIFGLFEGDFDPEKPRKLPTYIPSRNFVSAFLDIVTSDTHASAQNPDQRLAVLKTAALKLAGDEKTEKAGKPLVAMIEAAGSDFTKLQDSVAAWYNSAMDRVSGWYKYRSQWTLLTIGFVLAVAMNADTVRIIRQLSKDSTLRQIIVAAAQSAGPAHSEVACQSMQEEIRSVSDQVSSTESLGLPLGWIGAEIPPDWLHRLGIAGGWLLTAVAISLGAPFWFDLLNKFMVVRSTVKPQEKSKEEAFRSPSE